MRLKVITGIMLTLLLALTLFFIIRPAFSENPYVIWGTVKKNGVPQPEIDVKITNNATGDYDTVTTVSDGAYSFDLRVLEHGYSDGDNITVTLLISPPIQKTTYVDLTNYPAGREVHFLIHDVTPFEIIIISPQNITYTTTSVPLTFTVNETTSWIGYSLDNQANVTITGNTTLTGLALGPHNIIVYANDTYGNMGSSDKVYFTVQTQPVGGIYIPINKLELLAPYIALTILLAVAVVAVVYVKKRKRNTQIIS